MKYKEGDIITRPTQHWSVSLSVQHLIKEQGSRHVMPLVENYVPE